MDSRIVKDCFVDAKPKSTKPDEKNFSAKCRFCANKRVSGNLTSSSNFRDHIKVCYKENKVTEVFIVNILYAACLIYNPRFDPHKSSLVLKSPGILRKQKTY